MQLDLFENADLRESELMMQLCELKHSQDKLRRGLFQRYADLKDTVTKLQTQIEDMNKKECKIIWSA